MSSQKAKVSATCLSHGPKAKRPLPKRRRRGFQETTSRVFPHKAEEESHERGGGCVAREITMKTFGGCCGIRVVSNKRSESRYERVKRTNRGLGVLNEGRKKERERKMRGIRD